MTLSSSSQEALWRRYFEEELDRSSESKLTTIYCDNMGAMQLVIIGGYHPRRKHSDMRHHFINRHVENGLIQLKYLQNQDMAADASTKPLKEMKKVQEQLNLN